jgi:hypothetical protein
MFNWIKNLFKSKDKKEQEKLEEDKKKKESEEKYQRELDTYKKEVEERKKKIDNAVKKNQSANEVTIKYNGPVVNPTPTRTVNVGETRYERRRDTYVDTVYVPVFIPTPSVEKSADEAPKTSGTLDNTSGSFRTGGSFGSESRGFVTGGTMDDYRPSRSDSSDSGSSSWSSDTSSDSSSSSSD